jgi:hypothetical protein
MCDDGSCADRRECSVATIEPNAAYDRSSSTGCPVCGDHSDTQHILYLDFDAFLSVQRASAVTRTSWCPVSGFTDRFRLLQGENHQCTHGLPRQIWCRCHLQPTIRHACVVAATHGLPIRCSNCNAIIRAPLPAAGKATGVAREPIRKLICLMTCP